MHYFSQSSIFCMDPSAAAGLRQDFVNDRNGEILLCVTLPCITVRSFAERLRGWGAIGVVSPASRRRRAAAARRSSASVERGHLFCFFPLLFPFFFSTSSGLFRSKFTTRGIEAGGGEVFLSAYLPPQ